MTSATQNGTSPDLCERLASRHEVWQFVVQVQRRWRSVHGPCASVDAKIIRNCHSKLMSLGSVFNTYGHPSTSRLEIHVQNLEF